MGAAVRAHAEHPVRLLRRVRLAPHVMFHARPPRAVTEVVIRTVTGIGAVETTKEILVGEIPIGTAVGKETEMIMTDRSGARGGGETTLTTVEEIEIGDD